MRLVFLVLAIAARHCLGWRAIAAVELAACYQTEDQIRSPFTFVYDEVIINCLSVTPYGSVDKVILSAFNSSSNATARFTLTCVASALVFLPSPLGASRSTVGAKCLEPCADAEKPCYEAQELTRLKEADQVVLEANKDASGIKAEVALISIVFSVCILLVLSLCLHHRCCHHRVSPSPPAHGGSFPVYSLATVDNARYSCDSQPTAEHSNEDRHFVTTGDTTVVFGVLDGHDGERGVVSVLNTMSAETYQGKDMASFLEHMIKNAESRFFGTLEDLIREKESLSKKIPPHMKSYEASQRFPDVVARLEELDPLISGGCTAVVAGVCGNNLCVANVGDSRAVVVYQGPNGTLETLQLSTDHDVKNEDELKRLERLGLDPEVLKRSGRLGPHENTRSIGDYNIKGGYKSVDILRHASGPPGTAEPYVIPVVIEDSFLYLMLMSDGVYKSIEAAVEGAQTIAANLVLANMVHGCAQIPGVEFSSIAQTTLDQVAHLHEEAFQRSAKEDVRSPKAVACRKRDDMTLVVYRFPDSSRHD